MRIRALAAALVVAGIGGGIAAAPAQAVRVDDFTGVFTDGSGNAGYIEVDEANPAVRICNENEATPAGDDLTGYIWVNPSGEPTTPTYGNANIGAGDSDGEGAEFGDDCP